LSDLLAAFAAPEDPQPAHKDPRYAPWSPETD
jgi:hypothetical protein